MELLNEDKNTHLEHLEDDIINNGFEGGKNAIAFLEGLNEMLSGHSSSKVNVSVKWDGAPAIVCGPSPENGKFLIAEVKSNREKFSNFYNSILSQRIAEELEINHNEPFIEIDMVLPLGNWTLGFEMNQHFIKKSF